jgi:hypothetical protein
LARSDRKVCEGIGRYRPSMPRTVLKFGWEKKNPRVNLRHAWVWGRTRGAIDPMLQLSCSFAAECVSEAVRTNGWVSPAAINANCFDPFNLREHPIANIFAFGGRDSYQKMDIYTCHSRFTDHIYKNSAGSIEIEPAELKRGATSGSSECRAPRPCRSWMAQAATLPGVPAQFGSRQCRWARTASS